MRKKLSNPLRMFQFTVSYRFRHTGSYFHCPAYTGWLTT